MTRGTPAVADVHAPISAQAIIAYQKSHYTPETRNE